MNKHRYSYKFSNKYRWDEMR